MEPEWYDLEGTEKRLVMEGLICMRPLEGCVAPTTFMCLALTGPRVWRRRDRSVTGNRRSDSR
jgi:hypothetical protein